MQLWPARLTRDISVKQRGPAPLSVLGRLRMIARPSLVANKADFAEPCAVRRRMVLVDRLPFEQLALVSNRRPRSGLLAWHARLMAAAECHHQVRSS
jgi:hypothetical protein